MQAYTPSVLAKVRAASADMWSWLCLSNHLGAASRSTKAMRTAYLVTAQSRPSQLLWQHPRLL